jgi:hypothetical protein
MSSPRSTDLAFSGTITFHSIPRSLVRLQCTVYTGGIQTLKEQNLCPKSQSLESMTRSTRKLLWMFALSGAAALLYELVAEQDARQ